MLHSQQSLEYGWNKMAYLVDKYHKYAYGFYLGWENYPTYSPRLDAKVDVWLPEVVIEFVH